MKLRKFLLCAVALGAIASTTILPAQEPKKGKGGGRGALTIERVEEAVGALTDEQKTKIEAINAKAREAIQALPEEERQTKMREIMQTARTDIRAVLTPEQQKKFDEIPQGRGAGGGKGKKKDQ